ncbi:unnamed protein product [Phytophthora lilii]|uniref:Unnamed protein product n=1 Tax=Phytophthora lilii TaxID=2077276 RepID=A0A9W6YJK7_9STRA|nr:unnamed protein product [Phytophthora lilii]
MFAYELEGLKRLNIQPIKWGSSYRVKVRAKQYNVSIETLEKQLSPDYKANPKYRCYNGNHMESHLYEGVEPSDFYNKLENVLSSQTSAFKLNIALGYELVSKTDPDDTRYFYLNLANTSVFNKPVAINSKADIRKKVISEIRSMELADKLYYPSSGYKLRRSLHLRFSSTIASMLLGIAKLLFLRLSAKASILFRSFKSIDLLQLDEVEDCFQLGINVYSMEVASGNVECIRISDKGYEAMDILSHENHALYVKSIDMLQSKYQCPKCEMVFVGGEKLKNHKNNQCELVNIESFPAEPTIYKPVS